MTSFFSAGSPYLEHPLLTPERTANEVDFIVAQLDLSANSSVLDVGCAFGRHSVELAKRGVQVVGIDPAPAMINAAQAAATSANVGVQFQVAAAESYVPTQQFDAAIALFTVLGQINDPAEDARLLVRKALQNMATALKPSGLLLVEVPQRDPYRAMLGPQDRFEYDQSYTQITRSYIEQEGAPILVEEFEMGSPTGVREYTLRFRLFAQAELTQLLNEAGFTNLTWFANYEGQPLQPDSPMMLVQASR